MFRPNRIGTPIIHEVESLSSVRAGWIAVTANGSAVHTANVINGTPDLDFGRSDIHWTGGPEVVPAGNKWALVQQFTITQPIEGDAVGIEVNAAIIAAPPQNCVIIPCFGRLTAAGAGVALDPVLFQDQPTYFGQGKNFLPGAVAGNTQTFLSYKEQVVVRNANATIAGTYAHGFIIYDAGGAGYNVAFFETTMSVRQLNDQQDVGYRDTRR